MLRILIADDHTFVRESLALLLDAEEDMTVVACARDGIEAVELAHLHRPDVVLLDLSMPRLDGIEALREIKAILPGVAVVVLTMFPHLVVRRSAVAAGADGYLVKDQSAATLLRTLRDVAQGGSPAGLALTGL